MKHIVKWIVPLLLAAVAAGCGTERRSALEAYRSWPKGLSVSLTMPAEKLQQVKEAGFDYVEVTLNSLRGKSPEERLAAIGRFRADAEQAGLTVWSVHLPFGRAWDISSPDDSLRAVHFENSVNAINTLAEIVRDTGAQLLIEDLPRTCLCNTSDEMLALFGRTDPSVGICFDTNHLLQETPGRLPVPFSWPRAATTNLRFRHSPTLSSWGSKPPPYTVRMGDSFELSVPEALTVVSGGDTERVVLKANRKSVNIPANSISVTTVSKTGLSETHRFEKMICVLPTDGYPAKRYGA